MAAIIILKSESSRAHYPTVLRYGGIYERGSREYTLDDFYALQLDKLDKYLCLKESDVVIPDGDVESSSDDDDDDDDDDDEDSDDSDDDEEDGFDPKIEHGEVDEEDTAEIAARSREEDQQTAEIEEQAIPVDEESESKLSKVS